MGVDVEVTKPGDGKHFPKAGDKVTVHYTGTLKEDGSKFDCSRERPGFFECTIGTGQVIQGWDEGFTQLSIGTRAILHISPDYGYGSMGNPPKIPPEAYLLFDVELFQINGLDGAGIDKAEADRLDSFLDLSLLPGGGAASGTSKSKEKKKAQKKKK